MFKYLKHLIHVIALYCWLGWDLYNSLPHTITEEIKDVISQRNETLGNSIQQSDVETNSDSYYSDFIWVVLIQIRLVTQYLILLPVPQAICNLFGLTFLNAFNGEVKLKISSENNSCTTISNGNNHMHLTFDGSDENQRNNVINLGTAPQASRLPHLCFRVVTRGTYPELVQNNVHRNFLTCLESGLVNFSIEVVTDLDVYITNNPKDDRIRQIVVPKDYKTSTGALYKARALQYALETGVNLLKAGDYIIHLDEETIMTTNVINGISNFVSDGKYSFGQGLITYGNLNIVNILTTMADSIRVADDMGKNRFQLAVLHRPLFGWKGSFVVTRYEAELDVSFDHGPDGSIAEDCYFSMVAMTKGYKFEFIEGEMFEKSPFTVKDFIKQRRRWVQGIWLVVHSCKIPFRTKFWLITSHYAILTLPFFTINVIVNMVYHLPEPLITMILGRFCAALTFYMYFFGMLKTYDVKPRLSYLLIPLLLMQVVTVTLNALVENIAVIWGIFSSKHSFYVVKKNIDGKVILDS